MGDATEYGSLLQTERGRSLGDRHVPVSSKPLFSPLFDPCEKKRAACGKLFYSALDSMVVDERLTCF